MTTIYTGICTLSGTTGAMADITILESTSTNSVARPMLSPSMAEVVVASVGHIPSRRTNVGLSLMSPFVISCNFVIVMSSYNSEIGIGRAAMASAAFLTARAYALEVMVEAVMASRLPPSFLTVSALAEIAFSASKILRLRNCP